MSDIISAFLASIAADLVDFLPKPVRIGYWTVMGLFLAVLILCLVMK